MNDEDRRAETAELVRLAQWAVAVARFELNANERHFTHAEWDPWSHKVVVSAAEWARTATEWEKAAKRRLDRMEEIQPMLRRYGGAATRKFLPGAW